MCGRWAQTKGNPTGIQVSWHPGKPAVQNVLVPSPPASPQMEGNFLLPTQAGPVSEGPSHLSAWLLLFLLDPLWTEARSESL